MEIDRKTLKALAADTRLDILKSLTHRRKMPSELSKELNLATSTVVEHLERLEEANLVRREETGHKWIYYSLTEKGESLIKPRIPVQFVLVLSISLIVIFAGFVFVKYASNYAAFASIKGISQPGGMGQPTIGQTTGTSESEQTGKTTEGTAATGITGNVTNKITEQLALELANIDMQSKCGIVYNQIEKLPWSKEGTSWTLLTSICPNIENYNYSEVWRAGRYLNEAECSLPYSENCVEIITLVGIYGEFTCSYGLYKLTGAGIAKLEDVC
jgi:DNA-binding MarR family transcriptional regulator